MLSKMFNSANIEEAIKIKNEIADNFRESAPRSIECLELGFEDVMTVMCLPESIRVFFRTSNHIERLNRELKRRSKVIGIFPNVDSLNRLIGSVLIQINENWSQKQNTKFKKEDMNTLLKMDKELKRIADEQAKQFR